MFGAPIRNTILKFMVLVVLEAEQIHCLILLLLAGADFIAGALVNKPSGSSKKDPFESWTGFCTWLVRLKRCCECLIAAFRPCGSSHLVCDCVLMNFCFDAKHLSFLATTAVKLINFKLRC